MCRVLRIALMWLVALAVPLQGVAAATMLACGPDHAPAAAAPSDPHASHYAHAEPALDPSAATHHDTGDSQDGAGELVVQKCSVCASCCTAAMLPMPALRIGDSGLPDFVVPGVPADAAVFLTDGPERPPRILFD